MTADSSNGLLEGLNAPQREAVSAGFGPVLVLAGPGSGKTRVLTRRIAYLMNAMQVHPARILAVTFTNKAAAEMRHRVEHVTGKRVSGLQIGTFHAICARLLRIEHAFTPYSQDYVIYDTDDQLTAVGQAMAELNISQKQFSPRAVLNRISAFKSEMIHARDVPTHSYFEEIVARVYARYQSILLDNNAMDFDDLLLQTVSALEEHPALLEKYQDKYKWVLVDEFQDTNTVQYHLVKLWSAPQNNAFVVGDEDQSIYAFRGADYRNVLRFRQDYPDADVILLEQNYRSTQIVLDVARAVIDRNTNRTPKALFTEKAGGSPVIVREAYDEDYEAKWVMGEIETLRQDDGYDFSDFAVMYRTNAQSRALERACRDAGVPYTLVGGVAFYKRVEVKDMLAYLRTVQNPDDKLAFARIVNVPRRGIGQKTLADFQNWVAHQNMTYTEALKRLADGADTPLSPRAASRFQAFARKLHDWQTIAATGDLLHLFDSIVADTHYRQHLDSISSGRDQTIEREENLDELRAQIIKGQDVGQSLGEFLAEQSLMTDADTVSDPNSDKVTLLTLHAAKGLEYPVVFLTGLEDGLLPHARAKEEPDGIEEERRLLYVGVTRAMERLYLSYAFKRSAWGSAEPREISGFLLDIPTELLDDAPAGLSRQQSQSSYRRMTTWDSDSGLSRLQRDLRQSKSRPSNVVPPDQELRQKIIPFPGAEISGSDNTHALTYRTGMRVKHPLFGSGIVIDSEVRDGEEEVTVAFSDKRHGIKRLMASLANLTVED